MTKTSRHSNWAPAGRTLHLIDVENLAGAAHRDPSAIAETSTLYRQAVTVRPGDHIWVASNPGIVFPVHSAWPTARQLHRHGKDGADLALLNEADPVDIASRFDAVVIASGDQVFARLARQLRLFGLDVTVAAHERCLSQQLSRAASTTCLLTTVAKPGPAASIAA